MGVQPKIKILGRRKLSRISQINLLKLKKRANSVALDTGFDATTKYPVISCALVLAARL